MNTTLMIIIALAGGGALGYWLRMMVLKGVRGSMELEIKEMQVRAKEESQVIIDSAKKKAAEK